MPYRRALVILLLSGILVLAGCQKEEKRLEFESLLPQSWKHYSTYRLDTNEDGVQEWVILYTYDEKEKTVFSPVSGVVYHADRGEPPVIFPYPLVAPGWTYLGEGSASVRLEDVLGGLDGPELVFQDLDSNEVTTRVVIFDWEDHEPDKRLPPAADEQMGQWYHCVGQFSGDAGVKLEKNKVTLWERTADRSQLAIRKVYRPQQGSYMANKQLIAPAEICLDFAFGEPSDVANSPYPEKVLMAFFHNFTADKAFDFLTKQAQQKLRTGYNEWGDIAPWPRISLTGVCVKALDYSPDSEIQVQATMVAQAEATHEARATAETMATLTACPSPQCTYPLTPVKPQASPPVLIRTEVEFSLHDQTERAQLTWGLVKTNGVWRIDVVIPSR